MLPVDVHLQVRGNTRTKRALIDAELASAASATTHEQVREENVTSMLLCCI